MNPAEELTAAADKLDAIAWAATDGPWEEAGIGEFGWAVTASDHAQRFGVETEDSDQGKADAAYIAAMHPEVAKTLSVSLRAAARVAAKAKSVKTRPTRLVARLVEVARQINGSKP